VTCRDAELSIARSADGAVIPAEAAAHIAACERCRSLASALRVRVSTAGPSPEQLTEIKAGIVTSLEPVKPVPADGVLFLCLMLILALTTAAGVGELGIAGWRALDVWTRTAVFAALTAGSLLLAFSVVQQIVPGSRVVIPARTSIASVLGVLTGIFLTLFRPHPEPTFVATGLVCLRIGLECAIPAAALSWLVLRRGVILNPLTAGALTGVLAGLSGLAVLEVFCPNLNRYHILIWHLGATVISGIAGTTAFFIAHHFGQRFQKPAKR